MHSDSANEIRQLTNLRIVFRSQTGGSGTSAMGAPPAPLRPRIKRVNLKDMIFHLEQERDTCRSAMLYKAYLK